MMFSKKHSCQIFLSSNSFKSRKNFSQLYKPSISTIKVISCNRKRFIQTIKCANNAIFTSNKRNFSSENNVLESMYGSITVPNSSLTEYVWRDVTKWTDKPMITCGTSGKSYKYGDSRSICSSFANVLVSKLNMKSGEVLGLLLPNMPEYVFAIHGAVEAGIIVTFINPLYTPEEIERQFEMANVTYAVTITELLPNLEKATTNLKDYRGTIVVNTTGQDITAPNTYDFHQLISSQTNKISSFSTSPESTAVLPFSSGTTGLPKGVMLTHKNCVANLEQLNHPNISHYIPTTETFQEVALTVLPFFHIYGFNSILNLSMLHGIHIITMPKFVPEIYLKCLQQHKPSLLFVVPSLLLFLASHPSVKPEHLACVREIISGAAPATKSLIDNFRNKFSHDGLVIRQGYGMTELSPCALLTPLNSKHEKYGSAGILIKNTKARIVSLKDGKNQPSFESGELYIKGPQIMKGYWKNDKATKETIDEEGWLHTGDVAYYDDDQFFFIIDRTKELIKVKGNQVSPTELENIILRLPEIADVAVVGIPDVLADEIPKAFVVLKPNMQLTAEKIINFVNEKVVNYKRLAGGVTFLNSIPRNAAGKILRNELKVLGAKSK